MTPMTRRTFCRAAGATVLAAPFVRASDKSGLEPPVLGEGEHAYRCRHDWLKPPKSIAFGDTHGLCQDAQERIYVAHTVHSSSTRPDAVCVFDPDGAFLTSWGADFRGGAHGLDIRDEHGEEYLYHCDTRRRLIVKTALDGEVVWERSFPAEAGVYENASGWRPTNVAFAPDGDFFVGDGYGSSYIHRYTADGEYIRTIATPGSEPGQVSCPHGLWIDERSGEPMLAVADRSNRRIQYMTLDGEHVSFITEGIRRPCHFKTRGELMLVPDLESIVTILDGENKVVAALGDGHPTNLRGVPREKFVKGRFVHPHDAIFLANGNILVSEWVPIGRVTLLERTDP